MEYNELERILLYLSNSLNESNDTIKPHVKVMALDALRILSKGKLF